MHDVALLKAIRLFKSQAKLAKAIGVSHTVLNNWLNRDKKIPYQHAVAIAKATQWKVTLEELAPYAKKQNKVFDDIAISTNIQNTHHLKTIKKLSTLLASVKHNNEHPDIIYERFDELEVDCNFADIVITDPSILLKQYTFTKSPLIRVVIESVAKKLAQSLHQGGSLFLLANYELSGLWQLALCDAGLNLNAILSWDKPAVLDKRSHLVILKNLILWFSQGKLQDQTFQQSIQTASTILNRQAAASVVQPVSMELAESLIELSGCLNGNFFDPFATTEQVGEIAIQHGLHALLIEPNVNHTKSNYRTC